MPGSYQITAVDRTNPRDLVVTVAFTDDTVAGPRTRSYRFHADPDAASLAAMLKAERVMAFRGPAPQPALAPGAPVRVDADPVVL